MVIINSFAVWSQDCSAVLGVFILLNTCISFLNSFINPHIRSLSFKLENLCTWTLAFWISLEDFSNPKALCEVEKKNIFQVLLFYSHDTLEEILREIMNIRNIMKLNFRVFLK